MADNTSDNIVTFIIDTTNGSEEKEVDLDTLSLEQVAELVTFMPDLKDYYGNRLIAELDK